MGRRDLAPADLRDGQGRRFRGQIGETFERPELNPYVSIHKEYPEQIIPASQGAGLGARRAELFGREAPLHLEIGSGNGFYLSGMAALHPEADWVGLEIRFKRVVIAAKKLQELGLRNARVVRYDAFLIEDLFGPGTLAGIHVNHPDPWPKGRHEKHRLLGPAFLDAAARMLAPDGELRVKTDFAPHVAAVLAALPGRPFTVLGRVEDVARDGAPWPDEVVTNYQRKSGEAGRPVLALRLRRDAPQGPR